jgi:hypothetical protein
MDFQFLFNPLKNIGMKKPSILEIEGGAIKKHYSQPTNIKHFQPIVRKTKGGSLTKSNNIRMIF